jgi:hypothetical protein
MKLLPSAMLLLCIHTAVHAQTIRLTPARPQLLSLITLSATPASVSITLTPHGSALATSPISIQSYMVIGVLSTVKLYAYFPTTSALTSASGDSIPSSAVYGQCSTGTPTSFTAFTQTSPYAAGSSLAIYEMDNVLAALGYSRTDTLSLKIDLSGLPQQPAGSYSGTLILEAQAF